MTCSVCIERFNLSIRRKIECMYCEYEVCSSCSERYLLSTHEEVHCMDCKKPWSREFLVSKFSNKFVTKDYKKHRENVLLEKERSLMPETQPYVEHELQIRNYIKKCDNLRIKITQNNDIITNITENSSSDTIKLLNEIGPLNAHNASLNSEIHTAERIISILRGRVPAHKRTFVRACPVDGCRGFLSTAWKCGICDTWSCAECHEPKGKNKDDPHTCKPECLETAKMLKKDSKNCPKCASIIFKIDGCDQMFCTQCQTAFSWRTGLVETGHIHNPHYYEYMRNHGAVPREIGDLPCGGLPGYTTYLRHVTLLFDNGIYSHAESRVLISIHRIFNHIQLIVLPRYEETIDNNRDLRIKYMIGDIDENVLKFKLQQREKAAYKRREIRDIIHMYQVVTLDIMQKVVASTDTNYMSELFEIREHVNNCFKQISRTWGCTVHRITDDWNFI